MNQSSNETDVPPRDAVAPGAIDLADMLRGLRRRRGRVLWPTLAAVALTAVALHFVPPTYTAGARVLLESGDAYFTGPGAQPVQPAPALDAAAVASQVHLLTSGDVARRAIAKLGLDKLREFDPLVGGGDIGFLTRLEVVFGLARNPVELTPADRVATAFAKKLSVFALPASRVIEVDFSSKDPALAAAGADAVADVFIESLKRAKRDEAKAAADWLGAKVAQLRRETDAADRDVLALRAASGLLAGANSTTAPAQQVAELATRLAAARAAQAESEAKAKQVRALLAAGRAADAPGIVDDPALRAAVDR
ncbi:MAG: lipopolysaccharide biosynthesis protein, partial [Hyphomicrobiales bacterium]|nr:lipopolysaccharide biosynthesis protein [Hyphomicrobiales bacterium]